MDGAEHRLIPVSELLLDPSNPRYDPVGSQRAALKRIVQTQGDKLLNLASHIVESGLNPSEPLMVKPHIIEQLHDDGGHPRFLVLEGNRRCAALRILETPTLLPDNVGGAIRRAYKRLSDEYAKRPIEQVYCAVFPSREAAAPWIELKHTGENRGVGIVAWGALEQARFNQQRGKPRPALQAIEFVRDNATLDSDTKDAINSIAITNLERLLDDPDVREVLGVEVSQGILSTRLPAEEVLKGLTRIVRDLASKTIDVQTIRYKSDRKEYVRTFKEHELPDLSKMVPESSPIYEIEAAVPPSTQRAATKRSRSAVRPRVNVIPSNCVIRISNPRVNRIFRELKTMNANQYPNAAGILLRVFLELSVDHGLQTFESTINENSSLAKKVQAVAKCLEQSGIMDRHELKPVHVATSSPHSLFSVNTLHAYVHNPYLNPKPQDIRTAWDDMQLFISRLWEATQDAA